MSEEKHSPRRSMRDLFQNLPFDVIGVVRGYAPESFHNYKGVQIELAIRTILQQGELVESLFAGTDVSNVTYIADFQVDNHNIEIDDAPYNPNLFPSMHEEAMRYVTTSSTLVALQVSYAVPVGHPILKRVDSTRVWSVETRIGTSFVCEIGIAFYEHPIP